MILIKIYFFFGIVILNIFICIRKVKVTLNYVFFYSKPIFMKASQILKFSNSQVLKFSIKKILVFMTAAFVACSSPQINPVVEENSKPKGARAEYEAVFERIKKHPNYFEVRNREGILEFSTPQVFEEYRNKMTNQPQAVLDEWEKTLGFESMRSILEKAKKEEHAHFEAKMKKNLKEPDLSHSAYFKRYESLFDYEKGNISLKMHLISMATFLNEDGLVRIAGHLFQYTENSTKIIIGGDEKKLGLLKNSDKTDNAKGIMVLPIVVQNKQANNSGGRV